MIIFVIELQQVVGIEGKYLCVDWQVDIPPGWELDGDQFIAGRSQRAIPKYSYSTFEYHAFFGYNMSIAFKSIPSDPQHFPLLHVFVRSLDDYNRFCFQGYSCISLENSIGNCEIENPLYRPAAVTREEKMRRFHLGISPEFISTVTPLNTQHLINKYGEMTESEGTICLKFSLLSSVIASAKKGKENSGDPSNIISTTKYAVERARKRLAEIKTSL